MKHKVHRQVVREGQYEIWYDVMDDAGHVIAGNRIMRIGKKRLNVTALDKLFVTRIYPMIDDELNAPPPETTMTKSEVKDMLVRKGYLNKGDSLDDLPNKRTQRGYK